MLKGSHRTTRNRAARRSGGRHKHLPTRSAGSLDVPVRGAHRAASPASHGTTRATRRTRRTRRPGARHGSVVAGVAASLGVAVAGAAVIAWSGTGTASAEAPESGRPAAVSGFVAASAVLSSGTGSVDFDRDSFGATKAPATVPLAVPNDPSAAQAAAAKIVKKAGLGADQYACLVSMWTRESGWRADAANPSGAYGIPQALPGSKMAAYGADWRTNPVTQIKWGLAYVQGRYGSPCGAWSFWQTHHWY